MKSPLIIPVFLAIIQCPASGQKRIERCYDGGWANTFWKFEFSKDGTYKWASRGDLGNRYSTGTYQIHNDTLEIVQGYQDSDGIINRYYLIQGDSCIVDFKLRYDYLVHEPNLECQCEDERKQEIKYPQIKTNNQDRISDLDSVLSTCSTGQK